MLTRRQIKAGIASDKCKQEREKVGPNVGFLTGIPGEWSDFLTARLGKQS
jgi:hypothetical protein